jgi:hypothetical protein
VNGPQAIDKAEKLRTVALIQVAKELCDHYGDFLKEVIPNQLDDLLRRVVAVNEARCRERRSKR